jgi:ribose transport system substrate-binding protein
MSLINKPTPAFVTVDAIKVTSANLSTQWQKALFRQPPDAVVKALAAKK